MGGDEVENPGNTGTGRRQFGPPMKAGTREKMSSNNVVRMGRRRRGGATAH